VTGSISEGSRAVAALMSMITAIIDQISNFKAGRDELRKI
jgi:hypothetical protein